MAGGSPVHGQIAGNSIFTLIGALRGRGCKVYTSDVRVRLQGSRFYYPDVSVSHDAQDGNNGGDIEFSSLVVEVLSPATGPHVTRSTSFDFLFL